METATRTRSLDRVVLLSRIAAQTFSSEGLRYSDCVLYHNYDGKEPELGSTKRCAEASDRKAIRMPID
jgi:hypothetical protein